VQEGTPVEEGRWREEIRNPRGGRRERCGGNDTLPRVLGRPRGELFFSEGGERRERWLESNAGNTPLPSVDLA